MTGEVFLDTNVVLYALIATPLEPLDRRTRIAEEKLRDGGTISVQVLSEFVDVVSRKRGRDWHIIGEMLEIIESLCGPPIALTADTQKKSVDIAKRYGFRIYDSLILAAAELSGCTTLYTEDMQHGQKIGKVNIVNPFL